MNAMVTALALASVLVSGCASANRQAQSATNDPQAVPSRSDNRPAPFDMDKARAEVEKHYSAAHPEIREYILWTAETFGRSGLWLNEDAFANLSKADREAKVRYLSRLLEESEYGRHLCAGLAEASALRDKRLVPGLMKVAGYRRPDADYDCRAKWIAVSALARQESTEAVPLLVSLVDHGNQNTRNWARAALARQTGKDFEKDKQAWAAWWQSQGNAPMGPDWLKPWEAPVKSGT